MTTDHDVLRTLVDRQQIADLLARYCQALDEYDIDAVAATFADDVVTDYGAGRGGRVVGRDAVRDRIAAGQAAFRRTAHQLGQSLVELDGDRAQGEEPLGEVVKVTIRGEGGSLGLRARALRIRTAIAHLHGVQVRGALTLSSSRTTRRLSAVLISSMPGA